MNAAPKTSPPTTSDDQLTMGDAHASARPIERLPVLRFRQGGKSRGVELVAGEEPLEIRLEDRPVAVTMRTPGQDTELAVGFLIGETMIKSADIARVRECRSNDGEGGVANVRLWAGTRPELGWQRNFYATSSCGVCGKASIDALRVVAAPLADGPEIGPKMIAGLPDVLRSAQHVFERTGGLHAAGVFDSEGRVLIVREDVGRHNAVDKAIGRAALDGLLPLADHLLLVSGRTSFEIVQKALVAGIPIAAAISAPSTLAVRLARESGMTLIGFLRDGSFNVYSGQHRFASADT